MIDILEKLNEGRDRCVLIGRSGLNVSYNVSEDDKPFATKDFDIICPDLNTAEECSKILHQYGFTSNGATFTESRSGELDILIADPEYPEGVIGEYYNVPSLRQLWDVRERRNGILVPDTEKLIMNKLLYARENDGKDLETVGIYFALEPDKLESFIKKISEHNVSEERDTMLYSLYASMADKEDVRKKIEKVLLSEIVENQREKKTPETIKYPSRENETQIEPSAHETQTEKLPADKSTEPYSKKIAIVTTELKMGDGVNIHDAGDGRYTGKLVALTGEVPDKWAVLEVGDEQAVMFSVRDEDQAATLMSDETLAVISSDGVIDEVHEARDSEQELDGEYER